MSEEGIGKRLQMAELKRGDFVKMKNGLEFDIYVRPDWTQA